MIIDIHTHTFPEKIAEKTVEDLSRLSHSEPFTGGSDAALLESMERAGIDHSVILPVATKPSQVRKINDGLTAAGGSALIRFAAMHAAVEDVEDEIRRIASAGAKGIKLHPPYQGIAIDDPLTVRVLRAAKENGLIVLFHMGYDIGLPGINNCTPRMLRDALDCIGGGLTVIAAHMGGWRQWDDVAPMLADIPDVYLDTSFSLGEIPPKPGDPFYDTNDTSMLSEAGFMELIRAFGPDRVLFGSDSPWTDQKTAVNEICALPLTESEKALILGENAARLLLAGAPFAGASGCSE